MPASSSADLRRRLPSVDQVLQDPRSSGLVERHGRGVVLRVLRRLLDTARDRAAAGDEAGLQEALDRLGGDLADRVERARRPSLVRVLNATGVVVHTNLGRAPLSPVAAARVAEIASSYSNLEYDLAAGARGDREAHAEDRLRELLGAEGTVVVNNCAAAVLLALNTLAEGREVLVSRGELVENQGSGLLGPLPEPAHAEPTVEGSLRAGADLVTFSGDKLLGGPQAGLVAGRRGPIEAMRRNPLYRALRVDKMTLAALDAVLLDYEADAAVARVPVRRMLALGAEAVRARARALAAALADGAPSLAISVQDGESAVGGGAVPAVGLPTALLALTHASAGPDRLASALRAGEPPVIVRVAEDRVLVDLRTVEPADEPALLLALRSA